MGYFKARRLHVGEQALRWWRRRCAELHGLAERALVCCWRVYEQGHDDGRAAEVGYAVVGEAVPDGLGAHLPQADVSASDGR